MPNKYKIQGYRSPQEDTADDTPYGEPSWLTRLKSGKKEEPPKSEPPKEKQWFQVNIENTATVTTEYRVFAEDEDEAFKLVESGSVSNVHRSSNPKIDMKTLKKKRVTIKNLLTGWINWVRNF